ncbi:DUF4112 domain-containing protein [Okeania sp. SIO2B3]|uniref:DUF4112 domain-containing protein n=1 Tax=Okeania sp. SIO2B3 TaxID=2607784 RepID=UPI0013BFDA3C|nr:DUF4112 domain-containing protein [Okeania sp. SIO2B3]NET42843.1 DUF4112 domain-containing protein [Okeania sp. SIO2B3]
MIDSSNFDAIPADIEMYEARLLKSRNDIESFKKLSDGLLLGTIGVDAFIGIIPVVGGIYTGFAGLWMLMQASRVHASFGDMFLIVFLSVIDILIGIFVGVGDVLDAFFRIHAWFGGRLIEHIDMQLTLIKKAKNRASQSHNPDFTALRDILFRGGKTKQQQIIIYIVTAVVLLGGLATCSYMDYQHKSLRQNKIEACQQRNGWFCEWRY